MGNMGLGQKKNKIRKYLNKRTEMPWAMKIPDKVLAERLYDYKNSGTKNFSNKTAREYLKSVELKESCVYAIGNMDEGYVKIGFSTDPENRIKQIQTGCPFEVEVIKMWNGLGRKDEKKLHKAYSKYQAHGEWFEIKGRLKRDLLK